MAPQGKPAGSLGAFIRRRRNELGMTQEEFAERIGDGMRQSDVSRLERERVSLPRRPRLEKIAEALEITLGTLLRQSGWLEGEEVSASVRLAKKEPSAESPVDVSGLNLNLPENDELRDTLARAAEVRDRTARILEEARDAVAKARRTRRPER